MLFISVASWLVYVLIVCYFVFHFLSEKGMETLAIVSFMAVIIGSVTIFYLLSWSANIVDRIETLLIPIYKLSKDHQFYTEYDQSVIRVLELNTLLFYDRVPDKESTKVLEKLMDEGVNCRIEDDIEVFIKDEYFRKFIENEPIESILFPRGVKKYKRLYYSKTHTVTTLLDFISENLSLCKSFLRYTTNNDIQYGWAKKETIEGWKLYKR